MRVKGTIKLIKETNQVSEKFAKRELILTTKDGDYEQHLLVEFQQANCDKLDPFKVGEKVEVAINLRGREWTSPQGEVKYFNTILGWQLSKLEETTSKQPVADQDGLPF